ncbi:hypothetical protein ACH4U7_41080 [Streptomyces sp. NPDC020845]|uniref:hypothetical protein n=1 Tax=Streptomyces sp. NPDC020845 TaxID=3365096 RepID=UPI00379DE809
MVVDVALGEPPGLGAVRPGEPEVEVAVGVRLVDQVAAVGREVGFARLLVDIGQPGGLAALRREGPQQVEQVHDDGAAIGGEGGGRVGGLADGDLPGVALSRLALGRGRLGGEAGQGSAQPQGTGPDRHLAALLDE